jgi:hypothetical protein
MDEEEVPWVPDGYPESKCPSHPDLMWEWDGYGWICSGCVVGAYSK